MRVYLDGASDARDESMTKNLGEKIRQARREKGMTQEQLAQALFVSRQTVSNWENEVSHS